MEDPSSKKDNGPTPVLSVLLEGKLPEEELIINEFKDEEFLSFFYHTYHEFDGMIRAACGNPAVCHPYDVASRLNDSGLPSIYAKTAMVHDSVEEKTNNILEAEYFQQELEAKFGNEISENVRILTNNYSMIINSLEKIVVRETEKRARNGGYYLNDKEAKYLFLEYSLEERKKMLFDAIEMARGSLDYSLNRKVEEQFKAINFLIVENSAIKLRDKEKISKELEYLTNVIRDFSFASSRSSERSLRTRIELLNKQIGYAESRGLSRDKTLIQSKIFLDNANGLLSLYSRLKDPRSEEGMKFRQKYNQYFRRINGIIAGAREERVEEFLGKNNRFTFFDYLKIRAYRAYLGDIVDDAIKRLERGDKHYDVNIFAKISDGMDNLRTTSPDNLYSQGKTIEKTKLKINIFWKFLKQLEQRGIENPKLTKFYFDFMEQYVDQIERRLQAARIFSDTRYEPVREYLEREAIIARKISAGKIFNKNQS